MSPLDATFLHVEDAVSHMHIGSVGIFEGPAPDIDEFTDAVAGKLHLVPRYRQIVKFVPLDLARPVWVDDPHFQIGYHIRHTALPAPGGEAELRHLVGRVMAQALNRGRPLWEIWVVEGLTDDRWAMVSKVHHAMVDGVSGAELLSVILDLDPEIEPSRPVGWQPEPSPTPTELVVGAVTDLMKSPAEQIRAIRASTRQPRRLLGHVAEIAKGVTSILPTAVPTEPSSLNGPIGPHRRYAWADSSVDDIKAVRRGLGGTFNDVVLTAIAGGFRELLLARGESVDRVVRTMVPVSVRPRDDAGLAIGDGTTENKVSAMFAELPVGIADPVARLAVVTGQMSDLKESKQAVAAEALTSLSGFAPPTLMALGTRVAAKSAQRSVNTVTTNVPGPQLPLYAHGRRMLATYPYVPLAGQIRIGVAIFSYDGQVTYGITGDYDTCADLEVLADAITASMAELVDAAGTAS